MVSIRQVSTFFALAGLASAAPRQQGRSKLHKREALPAYAITYAPMSYLYSGEKWFPSNIPIHLENVEPEVNYTAIRSNASVTLDTLDTYASDVYLTASDAPSSTP
jgi:hypothetical protein